MKNQKISLCAIVQDEEQYIGRLLNNVKDYVDEMIIVDGGSKDKTIEICESFGAKVYHRKFDMDFATQRNFGLEHCNNNYVLFLDADEYCSEQTLNILKKIVKTDKNIGTFLFKIVTKYEHNNNHFSYAYSVASRLIRKDRGKWVNKIHESFIVHEGFKEFYVPEEYEIYNHKTYNRQLYNNALYYNLDNGIFEHPSYDDGMEWQFIDDKEKWVKLKTNRNQ